MLIEVLFVPGCPNHEPALERLRNVLHSKTIHAQIQEIAVTDEATARLLKFPRSPTVGINGRDVDSNLQQSYRPRCRLYSGGTGVPWFGTLQRAVTEAQSEQG
jgi:hypothetical protein